MWFKKCIILIHNNEYFVWILLQTCGFRTPLLALEIPTFWKGTSFTHWWHINKQLSMIPSIFLCIGKGLGDQGLRVSCQTCLWNHPKCRQKIVACTSKKLSFEQVAKKWGWATTSEWWSPKRQNLPHIFSHHERYSTTTWEDSPHHSLLFIPRFPKQCHVVLLWGSICWCFLLLLIDLADLPDSNPQGGVKQKFVDTTTPNHFWDH